MVCDEEEGISGEAKKAWVSLPCLGKHICFDGRYLHGAPAELALANKPSDANSVSERYVVGRVCPVCLRRIGIWMLRECCQLGISCNVMLFRIVPVSSSVSDVYTARLLSVGASRAFQSFRVVLVSSLVSDVDAARSLLGETSTVLADEVR